MGLGSKAPAFDSPKKIEKVKDVQKISCGSHQSFMLKHDGELYACGNNQFGQLGHSKIGLYGKPTHVKFDMAIQDVASGESHSLILTKQQGLVYAMGSNSNMQLGCQTSTIKMSTHPVLIEGLKDIKFVKCSVYSVAISERGDLFVWGRG